MKKKVYGDTKFFATLKMRPEIIRTKPKDLRETGSWLDANLEGKFGNLGFGRGI
jgi:hypothetical protein